MTNEGGRSSGAHPIDEPGRDLLAQMTMSD